MSYRSGETRTRGLLLQKHGIHVLLCFLASQYKKIERHFCNLHDGLFSCVSCYCRTFVALSSDTINRIQEPARTVHTTGRARHTPAGNEGITKCSPPCPAGNMGLTPTPCGHSREYPAQTKRRNFPKQIKRQSTSPAQSPLWTVFLYAWFFSLIRSKVLSRLFAAAASAD